MYLNSKSKFKLNKIHIKNLRKLDFIMQENVLKQNMEVHIAIKIPEIKWNIKGTLIIETEKNQLTTQ